MLRQNQQLRLELLEREIVEILRGKTPAERWQMAFAANRLVHERLRSHLSHEHPNWDSQQVAAEIARRMLWNKPRS